MFEGRGRLVHNDGNIYEGEFRNNKANGHVSLIIKIFRVYFTVMMV